MLVAAPAFVLLGSLAISHILDVYCAELWQTQTAGVADLADTSNAAAGPVVRKSKSK